MALNSTNSIAGLLEAAQLLSDSEKALATPADNVQISYDMEDNLVTINASLPLSTSSDAASGISIEVTDYAPVADFNAGAAFAGGSTVTSPAKAIAIMAEQINRGEIARDTAGLPLPEGAGVGLVANFDNAVLTINASLPLTVSINAQGQPVVAVTDYLA